MTTSKKTYREAVREALAQEMRRDASVVQIGEDLRGGHAGTNPDLDSKKIEAFGGVLGVTKGLWGEFGSERVIDTPITESAIIGMAAGAALTGLRPVAELMFMDFFGVCYDALYNQAAKFRYMFGGKARTPMVVRGMIGAGFSAAAQHSQSPYHVFASVPGLKVVAPSNAHDAKGLLIQAIREDDPVVFCEHKTLYDTKAEVPDEPYAIPFGVAALLMVLNSRASDRAGSRPRYVWPWLLFGGVAFYLSYLVGPAHFWPAFLLLVLAGGAMYAPYGPYFAYVSESLPKNFAGAGVGCVNTAGSFGGFIGTYLVGWLNDATGGTAASFVLMAATMVLSAALIPLVRRGSYEVGSA